MLSAEEIELYVYGTTRMRQRKQLNFDEARQVGVALGIGWDAFDVEQFAMGLRVELEHGRRNLVTDAADDKPLLTGKIVLAHLNEIPDYYARLAVVENETERVKDTR